MTFTDEQIMKEVKKNRKLVKQIGKSNNWWLFTFALILLFVMIIPHGSAWTYNCSPFPSVPVLFGSSYSNTIWPSGINGLQLTNDQANNMCVACGYPNTSKGVYFQSYSKYNDGQGNSRREYNINNYTDNDVNTRYVARSLVCNNAYMVRISDGACMGAGTGYTDYLIGMPQNIAECAAGTYYIEPLSATFSVVPSAGNQSLIVNITPNIRGNNLSRVVWDYDSNLGSETKYSGFNTSFNKTYNQSGRFTARLTAYNDISFVTASQNINVYNYTAGVIPTPTITPSITPTPTQNGTNVSSPIVIHILDYYNLTNVPSVSVGLQDENDVGKGWLNVTAINGDYTFSGYGSGGSTPLVIGHRYWLQFQKSGYITKDAEIIYTGTYAENGYYFVPSTYAPSTSSFVLQTKLYSTSTGTINEGKTGTVIISNQSSTWTNTVNNPPAGLAIFTGLTPGSSYKINIDLEGYQSYVGYFSSSSGMAGTTQYYTAYLTDTNILPSSYTLSVAPSSGTLNDTYTMTLTGDISGASAIAYKYATSQTNLLAFTATSGYTQYSKVGGSWKGWDGSTFSVSTANPASVTGKVQSISNPDVSTMQVTAYITVNGNVYQASDTVTMISQGKTPKSVIAYDMSGNGGATSANKYDFTAHILDIYANTWTNTTYTIDTYPGYYYVTPNALYQYYGSATGYYDTATQSKVFTGNVGEGGFEFRLYKITAAPTLANATLYAHARDSSQKNMEGVRITFSDGQKCFTNNAGSCGVYALVGGQYTAVGTAYGYATGTGSITVSNTSSNIIEILMLPASANRNNTVTVNPTSIIKTIPTYSNISGFNNTPAFEEYSCSLNPDGGVFDIFMNFIACAGVKGADKQGLTFAALVMFIFAMGLSNKGKSSGGALAGVIIGAVVSMAMGLIPFWILIVMIVMCGLIFAKLMTGSGPSGGQ